MFDHLNLGSDTLANPDRLQQLILLELHNRLKGQYTIADPNNGFNYLLEAGASIGAQIVRHTERLTDRMYPQRATNTTELYPHMSDFDYLHLTASPASSYFWYVTDADYLFDHAEKYDTNTKRMIIPDTTVIKMGNYQFGLYYPVDIRLNTKTKNISALLDYTVPNPLHPLSTNTLEYVQYLENGINFLMIAIPVYQFTKRSVERDIVEAIGYQEDFNLNDRFYACRAYTFIDGQRRELNYTLTEDVYDRTTATLKIKLQTNKNRVSLSIPQVYMNKKLIGPKLYIDFYTTNGMINVELTEEEVKSCVADFGINSLNTNLSPYSSILGSLKTHAIIPKEPVIKGGADGITFESLQQRIINGSLYESIPITPIDVQTYIENNGFLCHKYIDNITDRIYYATRTLVGGSIGGVPVTMATQHLQWTPGTVVPNIRIFPNGNITVLPTCLNRYVENNNTCIPLTQEEMDHLGKLPKQDLAKELNTNIYTRTPYHTVVYSQDTHPSAKSFNLLNPKTDNLRFIRDNNKCEAQMVVLSSDVRHADAGTGGYVIYLNVRKTENLKSVPENHLYVLLTINNTDGTTGGMYRRATFISSDSEISNWYMVTIPTTYQIDQDGNFKSTMFKDDIVDPVIADLSLVTNFNVLFLVEPGYFPDALVDESIIEHTPLPFRDKLGMTHQRLDVVFGYDLSESYFNITTPIWKPKEYLKHTDDVYQTYPEDVYARGPDGNIAYEIVNDKVVTTILHKAGDVVYGSDGKPLIKHPAGSYKRDEFGNLIVAKDRGLNFYVDSIQLDARLYASSNVADQKYIQGVTQELHEYMKTVKDMSRNLLEQTRLYFKPTRSIGSTLFGIGDNKQARMSLSLGFKVKVYVPSATLTNEGLKKSFDETIINIIEQNIKRKVISMTEIAKEIRATLSSNITSIDVLGINGSTPLQTLVVTETDVSPILALKLILNDDGTFKMERDVTITYSSDD